jgi:hypothetical protein
MKIDQNIIVKLIKKTAVTYLVKFEKGQNKCFIDFSFNEIKYMNNTGY